MAGSLLLSIALLGTPAQPPANDAVLQWNEAALQAIQASKTPPPLAARHLAILHIAMVDAIMGIRHVCKPFEVTVSGPAGASVEAAAAEAAHHVLTALYPGRRRQFDVILNRALASVGDGESIDEGRKLGRYVAKEVLAWRAEDGSEREVRMMPRRGPGEWEPTPPAFAKPLLAADGFKLVLVARKPGPLEEVAAELRNDGAEVRTLSADLSKPDVLAQVRTATDDIEVGLLIYNAGANNTRGLFVELPEEVTQSVLSITVLGQANFSRHYGALMAKRGRGGIILGGSLSSYLGSPTLATYTGAKAFSRIFSEALWAECAPLGVDVLHLNIGFTATPAMARLGMPVDLAEPPETVAREGLENIANGPVWIVSTPGNIERARMINEIDNRAAIVRAHAIVPRDQTAQSALENKKLAEDAKRG